MAHPDPKVAETLTRIYMSSGPTFRTPTGNLEVERSGLLGQLKCSGRLVACDPHGIGSARPFVRQVRPGMWGVYAVGVKLHGAMRRAAAWAGMMKGFCKPVHAKSWVPAHLEGDASEAEASPVRIDSGTIAYCDGQSPAKYAASKPALAKLLLAMEMPVPGYPHRASAGAVVGLLPGMGDGQYFSYWGLDDAGEAIGLLTDFALVQATARARAASPR